MVLFMICVNLDTITLWTISEELSKPMWLVEMSLITYGCSNWVREESNFSNRTFSFRLYKPCFKIAVVMTNQLDMIL
jgi:hypothetical protein